MKRKSADGRREQARGQAEREAADGGMRGGASLAGRMMDGGWGWGGTQGMAGLLDRVGQ